MRSQGDIALENQKATEKANERQADTARKTEDERATRYDGNPSGNDAAGGVLKPKDDTPWHLEKREHKKKSP